MFKLDSNSDFERIKFDWNGKHGDDLEDPNMDFRMEVCEFLIKDFSIATDKLILDLYQELSNLEGDLQTNMKMYLRKALNISIQ